MNNKLLDDAQLEQVREIFARYPNKNMQTETFDADKYKLVPIEPTEKMTDKGICELLGCLISELESVDYKLLDRYTKECADIYKAMLAVSPPINTEGE